MSKITPCLWFDNNAEEAINFYISVFPNSKILDITRMGEGGPGPQGMLFTAALELNGQEIMVLNGGPAFKFTEAISMFVNCETQQEVDRLWDTLSEGGEKSQCGWLKDRYGLSWQIVPSALGELMSGSDPERVRRVTEALLKMDKLDIAVLQQAYDQA